MTRSNPEKKQSFDKKNSVDQLTLDAGSLHSSKKADETLLSLYLHFPYCLYKCHYCDFNSYAVQEVTGLEASYVKALMAEWDLYQRKLHPFQIRSIFLGGGTPSLFSVSSLTHVLNYLRSTLPFSSDCEITLEANPKTLTAEKIEGFERAGINRFSVGIQSFQDRYLIPLGRIHSGLEAKEVLMLLKKSSVRFSLDLIYGFPQQSVEEVLEDLKIAISFSPSHLSFYNLTVEKNTRLAHEVALGQKTLPDEESQIEMFQMGEKLLEKAGYFPYEISNFSQPGFESRHNLNYWRYGDYLGLGAGAVSFLKMGFFRDPTSLEGYGLRWTNPLTPKDYLKFISEAPKLCPNPEPIDFSTARSEFWMMGARLREGISRMEFENRFGKGSFNDYALILSELRQKDWIVEEDGYVRLTEQGRLLTNEVVACFFR